MKIGLVQTYYCPKCNRYAYPQDVETSWPEDHPRIWHDSDVARYWVIYECACKYRHMRVEHFVDGDELFPHYPISKRD